MSKFLWFGKKLAATAATAATFCSNTVATLLSQGSSTGSNTHDTLHSLLSRLKMPFNSLFGSSSSSTSPNFAQENELLREGSENPPVNDVLVNYVAENHDANTYSADEFDHEDYDEWWENNNIDWWDDLDERLVRQSWEQQAVDEAIEQEEPGEYPPCDDPRSGDIPF